ncbi:MAG: hypothetical protein FD167_5223, partial [bacterium]
MRGKIYIPQDGYDMSDYFFSYLGKECFEAMHIEVMDSIETKSADKPVVYIPEEDTRNDKFSSYKTLVNLIDNVDYQKYILVGLALYNKLAADELGKQLYKDWAISNYKDKSDQIDYNWEK